jgi:hypothetical protein
LLSAQTNPKPASALPKATPVFEQTPVQKAGAAAAKVINPNQPDWRFAHAKPDLLLSINIGQIVRSGALAQTVQQGFNMTSDADKAKIDLAVKMIGSVDRVQLSLKSNPAKPSEPDYLVLVTGQLDSTLRQLLAEPAKEGSVVSRQLSSSAVLFGKSEAIELAARRASGVSAPAIADELSSSDLWVSGETNLLTANSKGPLPPGLDELRKFSFGMSFRDPIELKANLAMASDAGAGKLLALLNLGMMQAGQTAEAADWLKATKLTQAGSQVQFRFSAPAAMVAQNLAKAQGLRESAGSQLPPGLLSMMGIQPAAAPAPVAEPAAPPQNPGKIMIYGLDEGPREVGAPKQDVPKKD